MVLALQAAARWGVKPTEYLDPEGPWSIRDRGLAEGLLLHERGLGPHGVPMSKATDEELGTYFTTEDREDYVQALLDRWQEEHKKSTPGMYPALVDNTHLHYAKKAKEAERARRGAAQADHRAD